MEIFLASILYTLLGVTGAFYFKFLIDSIIGNGLKHLLHVATIGILGLRLFEILLGAFREHLLIYFSQKLNTSLSLSYYKHVINLPMSFFDSRKIGEITSRLDDASKIRGALSGATFSAMLDVFLVVFLGIVLCIQNANLFMIMLPFIPVYIVVMWGFSKYFRKKHREVMEKNAKLNSYLVESLSGVKTIKAFNGEEEAKLETEQRFIKKVKSLFKVAFARNIQSSIQRFLGVASTVLLLWLGALEIMGGNLSIGQLMAFNALMGRFLGSVKSLINLQPMLQEAFVAGDRLGEILDLEKETNKNSKVELDQIKGEIQFENIEFAYGHRKPALKNINLEISPQEKIALVGESGSGKSTLIKLILKYYLPDEGNVLLDGYNIKDIDLNSLRGKIGYVPQDVFIFSGTVKENIAFGLEDISTKEVIEAAKKAQIHEYINDLPARYDTMLQEQGSNLSGGQKQRIAIARAILREPDILILDEATSNLDTATEKAIHSTFEEVSEGITTIIIAHRLSTINHCDKIVVLDDGEISEVGSHEELLKKQGKYYELWEGQLVSENINLEEMVS